MCRVIADGISWVMVSWFSLNFWWIRCCNKVGASKERSTPRLDVSSCRGPHCSRTCLLSLLFRDVAPPQRVRRRREEIAVDKILVVRDIDEVSRPPLLHRQSTQSLIIHDAANEFSIDDQTAFVPKDGLDATHALGGSRRDVQFSNHVSQ